MMRKYLLGVILSLLWCGAAFATNCSGTITSGGTAQFIPNIGSNTRGLLLMNNSANLMCVSFTGNAATISGTNCGAGSWPLQPGSGTTQGGSFSNPANITISVVSIISSGTGDPYSCERQ